MTRSAASNATPAAVIACSADGDRWLATGAVTFANAGDALARARTLPLPKRGVVDLSGLHGVDSTAVALVLALRRTAAARGGALTFTAVPPALASLAALYGVEEFLDDGRAIVAPDRAPRYPGRGR